MSITLDTVLKLIKKNNQKIKENLYNSVIASIKEVDTKATHPNRDSLDKISESTNGNMLYNGKEIPGGTNTTPGTIIVSPNANNALIKNSNGYYVPAFLISQQANNALVKYSDGYYAPKLPVNYATTVNIDSAKDEINNKLTEQNKAFNERYDVITEKIQDISSNVSKFTTHEFVGRNATLISVIDISTLYSLTTNVILNLEFMIKNNSDIDMLTIKILENETETLSDTLTKSEVQKYKLPNIPNIEIFIQGNYSLFLYVNYI